MSDRQRGLVQALSEGTRDRLTQGRRAAVTWRRRAAPTTIGLRAVIALAYFIAAELAVPPDWAASGIYIVPAAVAALAAALRPAGVAPLVASVAVVGLWLLTTGAVDGHGASMWTAAGLAVLLYAGHVSAAVAQRFRTTTKVDSDIIHTWARHLGIVTASTVGITAVLSLFTAYFEAIPPAVALAAGIVSAVTVIYLLARSLHNPSAK
ncbi:hypothetical protein [Glycomyces buryatensis]|uniref:Uncharacterized protein n=1 Tax=Glycomyces buryatensis TaxID=2570927 RepID=A0A4S8QP23_9ACTN|nr:hypothetical protein [Glycomyces buryatensis]THV43179.1 hypothetical protein FAB82_02820 [Glycomyces buryatensis]